MARDRANINTNIWTDTHWRLLTSDQHWLYMMILTHPSLSYAGVTDWRPGRLMQFTSDKSRQDIERLGNELQAERFIFIDEDTEEVLVRSFTRHDGLLKQPKLTISMVNAYGAIASNKIREVFIHELKRMHGEAPNLKAFENEKVLALLKLPARPMQEFTLGFTPELTLDLPLRFTPNASQAQALPTTTATTTSTSYEVDISAAPEKSSEPGAVGTRIPNDFHLTSSMTAWALEWCPNLDAKSEISKFKDYYRAVAGRNQFRTDWEAAWRLWMTNSQERITPPRTPSTPTSAWDRKGVHGYEEGEPA